jgi:Flp pilus assembly CpaF family ATPase
MPRSTPQTFRRAGDGQRSYREALADVTTPLSISEPMRSAVAAYVHHARTRAELVALAQQYDQPLEQADSDLLDAPEFDQLLDPEFDPTQRRALFRRLLTAALAQNRLDGVDPGVLHDEALLTRLWDETCGWGHAVQQLLDDPEITEIKILGTTAVGDGPRGRVRLHDAFASVAEPLSRAEFLAQSYGVAWNRESPSVTLPLRSGMRMHITRDPRVVSANEREPGLLIVMRRGRRRPWTLRDLVERGMLDRPAAALLTGLMHAGCSILISGQQGAGKTTVLESLLSTLDPDRYIVLIEDNANEFRLHETALVSRLRIDDSQRTDAWKERQATVRENLRLTPDVVVLSEVRGDEAGAVLQQAEAGRPTLTTIHADSAEAALQRFARLAATAIPNNSFAGAPLQAMRVASEAFHVVVHVAFSQRLRRRFVQHVLLLHGLGEAQLPRTLALVESRVDAHALTWCCNARLEDRGLVWEPPGIVTPPAVAERLADIPEATWSAYCFDPLARPVGTPVPEQGDAYAEALVKAHAALREGAWQEAVIHLDAAAQQRHDHQVVSLIDAALVDLPELAQVIDQTIAATIQDVRAALQAGDLERARVLINAPPANAVVQRRQLSHVPWQSLSTEVTRRAEQVIACQSALTRANVQQHEGDLRGALQTLRPFDARLVGPELAPVLLTARQRVLMRLLSQVRGDAAARQQYTAELEQANRDLAELHGLNDVGTEPAVPAGLPAAPAQVVIEPVRPAAPVPQLPAPTSTSPRPPEPMPSAPGQGWLDEALARSRERLRLRQSAQADGEGTP